jgi:hypothetical protein
LDLWLVGWEKRKSVGVRGMKERILREGEDLCVGFWGGGEIGEKKQDLGSWGKWGFFFPPFLMKLHVMGVRSLFLSFLAVAPLAAFGLNQKHKR